MQSPAPILAQADTSDFVWPVLWLLIIVMLIVMAVRIVRFFFGRNKEDDLPAAGFSLASLRELVKQGKMTPEEYEKAKAQIVVATQRATARKAPVAPIAPEMKSPKE